MGYQSSIYTCDRCGIKSNYLSAVFEHDNRSYAFSARLCDPCFGLFFKHYSEWCKDNGDPKPISDPVSTKGFLGLF